jgi:FHA domain
MSTTSASTPRLVVLNGRMRGASFAIPSGRSEIGREAGAAIRLGDDSVSRRHAVLERREGRLVVADLGSTNGTWVNSTRLDGSGELRDGDEVRFGSVALQLSASDDGQTRVMPLDPPGDRQGQGVGYAFGDVHGPLQTGSGRQYVAGRDQQIAGRDILHDQSVNVENDYDPWDEVFRGKGVGRVLMALGGCIALVGFVMWMYLIFTGFGSGPDGPGDAGSPILERELVPGVPLAVAALALFLAGGVLAGIGGGMSKAARKRAERARRERRLDAR